MNCAMPPAMNLQTGKWMNFLLIKPVLRGCGDIWGTVLSGKWMLFSLCCRPCCFWRYRFCNLSGSPGCRYGPSGSLHWDTLHGCSFATSGAGTGFSGRKKILQPSGSQKYGKCFSAARRRSGKSLQQCGTGKNCRLFWQKKGRNCAGKSFFTAFFPMNTSHQKACNKAVNNS